MKTLSLFICIVAVTSSCSNNPPQLDSNKALTYSFEQPNRKVVSVKQSKHLGKPNVNTNNGSYYSANGTQCRKLSNRKTVCFINGKWHEAVSISGKG